MVKHTVFSQMLQLIYRYSFKKCVDRYHGDRYTKRLNCWQQFIVLLYAQSRGLKSLREIQISLQSQQRKWYHLGIVSVARSTLSDANATRSSNIFQDIFYEFLAKCQSLSPRHQFKFKNPLYTMDSSLIHLCLSLFPWAKYRKTKGALKLHTLLDHSGCLPTFVTVTDGKCHDINVVRDTQYGFPRLLSDSIITVDRAYIDYKWLYSLTMQKVFFVTRVKRNIQYSLVGQHEIPKNKGVISDQSICLTGFYSTQEYPDILRLITYYDFQTNKKLLFLTNNFTLSAYTIAELYKARWHIELFFKWIKQNLKIKTFLGTSENAVMTQIWIAMIYYLLLSFIKFQTKYSYSLQEFSRIIKELLMDYVSLFDTLRLNHKQCNKIKEKYVQLSFY
jgi:hypothetical protein